MTLLFNGQKDIRTVNDLNNAQHCYHRDHHINLSKFITEKQTIS